MLLLLHIIWLTLNVTHFTSCPSAFSFLPPRTESASLALFSAAQAASRVMTGSLSESALQWRWRIPRPAFFVLSSLASFSAHVLLAVATTEIAFVFGVVLSGAAFGMIWPLMVLTVGEQFGLRYMAQNYMFFDGSTSAFGTLFFNFIAQDVYESHIIKHSDDDGLVCFGESCFAATHFVIAGFTLTSIVSASLLTYKTRHLY